MEVVLTADKTLMSNYHGKIFLGFGTSAPPNWLPEQLFRYLFFPKIKTKNGVPWQAPYGLRKIEAKLIDEGFDVKTIYPDYIDRYDPRVIGIHVMDPFGWGPSSTTFTGILKTGEPYLAKYFRLMLENEAYQNAKEKGAKTIVGGPGVWQFKLNKEFMDRYGIDCVLIGEGEHEKAIKIYRMALKGKKLPRFVELKSNECPSLDEISEIKNPSVDGLTEIGRGCPRGCRFCSVTLRPLRWYPYGKIEKELKVNANAGVTDGILHAEDVLLYGQNSVVPDDEKVLKLNKLAKKYYKEVGWSHASFAAVACKPKLIEKLSGVICDENQTWWGVEMGIETGSIRLAKKIMPAKAKPFKVEEWPEIVIQGAGIMKDNNVIPACTLITGSPEETDDDVLKTIELIDELKDFPSLIVPLFFVPLGRLKDKEWFKKERLSDVQKELLLTCLHHDIQWVKKIGEMYFNQGLTHQFIKPLYYLFIKLVEWQGKRKGVL
ncbi:MAG TPA: B12-binding domain-containing radical SAM protein [Thermoplasmatales archaeon]|nr:B12-binding domain-containing radical SAM protein [Thermoplasmatales archaeon]